MYGATCSRTGGRVTSRHARANALKAKTVQSSPAGNSPERPQKSYLPAKNSYTTSSTMVGSTAGQSAVMQFFTIKIYIIK